ncbi:uncharacterized protein LOC6643128 isoform X2 [Drosophila willistoni]|uniref:uncharacterized protein LOC6643128 isoform X2 n=1 Tax=Drosophila willistoni TaxID=7260 RepID=UPI000C26D519|nr:uncharacterized protein LOC6643128 isoform X2 [Drosophila willistoni]
MSKGLLGLWLLLAVLNRLQCSNAYQSGGSYYDAGQSGLSASTQSSYGGSARIQEQPIYERESACPAGFTGLKPYPHDCHRFVNCFNGRPTIQTCAPGTLFDARNLQCDSPSKVSCNGDIAEAAAAAVNSNQSSRSARLRQINTEPKCPAGVNGLHPHPFDCTKFLNCANGQTFVQSCGPGTAFSASLLICDYKNKVDCGAGISGGVAASEAYEGGYEESSGPSCPPGVRGLYPHPHDQRKYLRCGIGVKAQVEQCPATQIFDGQRLVCVFSATATNSQLSSALSDQHLNDLLCPAGVVGLFAHPFDQTKYLHCKAGKVAIQSCIPNYVFSIPNAYCKLKTEALYGEYVAYIVSVVSYEYSLILTACPAGTDGLHLYPYDGNKYIRCSNGKMSILRCEQQMAFSLSQRICRPRRLLASGDYVRFFEELQVELTGAQSGSYSYRDSQAFQSSLSACPRSLQGNYPYPFHGAYFIRCQNGLLQVESCPRGFVYSLGQRKCGNPRELSEHDYLSYSHRTLQISTDFMQDLTTVTCPTQISHGYYPHPFDCTKYLICRDQQTSVASCDQGTVFSISQQVCVARDQLAENDRVEYLSETQHEFYNQEEAEAEVSVTRENHLGHQHQGEVNCPPGAQGLQPHPFDCTKFLNCANGQTFIQNCGPGTAWNRISQVCDHKDKVAECHTGTTAYSSPGTSHGSTLISGNSGVYIPSASGSSFSSISGNGAVYSPATFSSSSTSTSGNAGVYSPSASGSSFSSISGNGAVYSPATFSSSSTSTSGNAGVYSPSAPSSSFISGNTGTYSPSTSSSSSTSISGNSAAFSYKRLICPSSVYGLFPHPFDGSSYVSCQEGHTQIQQCPSGHVFSLSQGYCVYEQHVASWDHITGYQRQAQHLQQQEIDFLFCPQDGHHVYPFDCSKFLSCEGNDILLVSCPPGEHFSFSQHRCQGVEQVQRQERLYTISELLIIYEWWQQIKTQSLDAAIFCPMGLSGSILLPHPRVPSKYLTCPQSAERRLASISDCSPEQIFSISRKLCLASALVARNDRCDYNYDVMIDQSSYESRQSKAYNEGRGESAGGNRWSSMNMQRPAGIGFTNYHQQQQQQQVGQVNQQYGGEAGGWSGHGTSFTHRIPTQSVLYVEGSLQPNRNYPSYKTPLAPMAPASTDHVYYANPVVEEVEEEEEDQQQQHHNHHHHQQPQPHQSHYSPNSLSRQDFSRDLVGAGQQYPNHDLPPLAPLGGQQPLDLDYTPDAGQQSVDLDQNLTPHSPSHDQFPSETHQEPVDLYDPPVKGFPTPSSPLPHQPVIDESNLYGGLQPPPPPAPTPAAQPSTPSTTRLPTNLRTFPIYPPMANVSSPKEVRPPHYSPGYAAVAHSHNTSWQKIPPPTTTPKAHDPFIPSEDIDDNLDEFGESTTKRHDLSPPPFDHKFYNPTLNSRAAKADSNSDPSNDQRIFGEALRLMLRPYFNHSGNAPEILAKQTESAIATVISKPPTSRTIASTSTTTTPRNSIRPDDDVELIVAGEQESLDIETNESDSDSDSVVPDAEETTHTEQTINPTTYAFGDTQNDFHRGTRKVDIDSMTTTTTTSSTTTATNNKNNNNNNWHTPHNRDFHRRHPNLPDPFEKPHSHHQHQHHNNHHYHSPLYHSQHPELLNPFRQNPEQNSPDTTTPDIVHHQHHHPDQRLPKSFDSPKDQDEDEDEEYLPNPNAEETTPKSQYQISMRSNFQDNDCEFDCGNGKCIKQKEVCNGVNNCGPNRRDESQCQHLGYQVRLTGGENSHMGRVEVKVNGQWGYVCDDKFGLRDADVVCRELGYKMGAQEVRGNSYYAPPDRNFNYMMDKVECQGNETMLKDCQFKGWGIHNCGVDEVVGVVCKVPVLKCPNNYWLCHTSKECIPPAFVCDHTEDCADKSDESEAVCKAPIEYRLEGGRNPSEGRLEVKYHGVWGSVCDDDFSAKSAQIACNSLGYYGSAKIEKNIFGPASGPIWLDEVMCHGNESSIDKCSHWNWGEHNCNHTEDVSLRCTAGPPPTRQQRQQSVRLHSVGGGSHNIKGSPSGQISHPAFTLSDIGLWERSSKALHTPRRCGIFKDDLTDEYAHPEERVIKGNIARRGRHPWQATIRTRGRGGISSHWCGAVVISKRHLLTAAHCLYGHPKGSYFVRVGDHYANIAESSEVDSFIENWYTHEKFRDGSHMNNDIAVIVLKTPLKFSDYVQPICLPEKNVPLGENRTCTISGWGSIKSGLSTPSQILRSAQLPILSDATCKRSNVYGDAMTDGMFCAGSMDESVDACEGDSGGPLVCSDEDGETLYGIISWGQHCGYQNRPGVYVRVCHYIDWIYEKINHSLTKF